MAASAIAAVTVVPAFASYPCILGLYYNVHIWVNDCCFNLMQL